MDGNLRGQRASFALTRELDRAETQEKPPI